MERFTENSSVTRRMVDQLVKSATNETDLVRAWRKLVTPKDKVGIKVNAAGGKYFATRIGVVRAMVDGLEQAGVDRKNVIVWDRESSELREAGYDSKRLGVQVRGIDPPRGWDRSAPFAAPTLGKLIWGDLLFSEKNRKGLGKKMVESDQLSSNSYFPTILTKDVTKIINVPTLTDDAGCGVGAAFYNIGVRNLDNWRRFVSTEMPGSDSIPDIYDDPNVGPKVVLHVLDGLIAQYAGGPVGNPNYAFPHATLYASTDPVAIDSVAVRNIETWRKMAKLPPITRRVEWLKYAEQMGIGVAASERISLVTVTAP
ncbi:MAG TPA: DUF362 domain-containing protein [Chthoniobacteraceae bacterium]|jgi:hypothetical protein|nr:DUF362 domain-containing protein [Chthoniobacteraceae bacterium]